MFEVAVYTDVRADEALDGVAGFNFLAESAGVTGTDRQFIAQRMLHVVKSSWHVESPDELAHPESCIYRKSGGKHYMSRGKSIGKTVTAPRPGNQLTQAILTSDPEDFTPYRPAQLYAAMNWNLSRETGGKQIPSWPTPLEIDERYEPDELKLELVEDSPFGSEFLPQFLTMVEQAVSEPARKMIIVHTDLDLVMRYIALASLFLDFQRSLDLSFVAFAEDPLAVVADIVGATPDFGTVPSPSSGSTAYNVIDLLAVQMTPVEVSESAARQAQWFAGGDAVDALAAVDLARRWEPALGATVATDAAGIVSFAHNPVAAPHDRAAALRAVSSMVAVGLSDDLAMYADELLDAVVTSPPNSAEDIVLAADAVDASHLAGMDDVGIGILLPTLEVLAGRPDLIPAWCEAVSKWRPGPAPLSWDSSDARGHALQSQAHIIDSARTEDLAHVLIAARISGLLPEDHAVAATLDRFADYWSQHPALSALKDALPYQASMGHRLARRLVTALESHDQQTVHAFVTGEWNWLAAESALALWRIAVEIGATSLDRRPSKISERGSQLPPESWRIALADAEITSGAAAVARWIETHPHVPADLGAWIFSGLTAAQKRHEDAKAARKVVVALLDNRATTSDPELKRFIGDVTQVDRLHSDALRAADDKRNPALAEFAVRIAPYVGFFDYEVGILLVEAQDWQGIRRLEQEVGDRAHACIDTALKTIARRARDADAVEWALNLHESGTEVQRAAGLEYLVNLMDSRQGRQRLDEVREELAPSWIPLLDSLVEDSKKGRLTRNLVRGGKRLLNKER